MDSMEVLINEDNNQKLKKYNLEQILKVRKEFSGADKVILKSQRDDFR